MTTRIEIANQYEAQLQSAGLAAFDDFMTIGGGEATSSHRHRETVPVSVGDGRFFLKRVFKVPAKHTLGPWLRFRRGASQPAQEWRVCRMLRAAGIPAMEPVAFGERSQFGIPVQAFILVAAVPLKHTLENWLVPGFERPPAVEPETRLKLFEEIGRLVKSLHDAGFEWPDISAKHIYASPLERPRGERRWEFAIIDLERATKSNESGRSPGIERSLAKLIRSLSPMVGDEESMRCLLRAAGVETDRGRLTNGVPRLPDDYRHPRNLSLRRREGVVMAARWEEPLRAAGYQKLDDFFKRDAGLRMDKPGLEAYRDRIRIELDDEHGKRVACYLKRFVNPPLKAQIRRILECGLKSSSGSRELTFIRRLSLLGIPTMNGVAFGQHHIGMFENRSFSITEEITGRSLETLANQVVADPSAMPSWHERREIIRQLALITRHLHDAGLFHRDLYLCHVFLCRNADGAIVLRLIDLGRMIRTTRRRERWTIKDLAALHYSAPKGVITRADRIRFLYDRIGRTHPRPSRSRDVEKAKIRGLVDKIEARVRRMARHDANRARRFEKAETA